MEKELIENIKQAVLSNKEYMITELKQLVACDSTLGNEYSAQQEIMRIYKNLGLSIEEIEIDIEKLSKLPGYSPPVISDTTGRINVIGIHTPNTIKGKSLILNGHIDVVPTGPAALWSRDPYEPHIDGDWFYGRGSGDMKAGIVAYCTALIALRDLGYQPAAKVYLQSVVEEECTGNGALACIDAGYKADAAIIPEPFGQTYMTSQLGVMWFQIKLYGKPAHVLNTSNGTSVFDALNLLNDELKKLESAWNDNSCRHHSYTNHNKPINFNLGKIHGGDWASTVPCYCEADFRVGFFPNVKIEEVKQEIENTVNNTKLPKGISLDISYSGFQAEGFTTPDSEPLLENIKLAHYYVTSKECSPLASTATTDCRFFHLYGETPATCYGPIAENIHGIDERVSINSTLEVAQVLAVFIAQWCGLEKINI